ncbi:hypothetical protein EVAR_60192_1 [Eumeta japonica]|uniref:Uncharacterized protein n=1 Tax=Eumeta variegata TaxID=151549 RepID=A0A4C1Z8N9_EUMVA|nr:hypothetical protein EVAR_60192_1 [Eumeta japonica]
MNIHACHGRNRKASTLSAGRTRTLTSRGSSLKVKADSLTDGRPGRHHTPPSDGESQTDNGRALAQQRRSARDVVLLRRRAVERPAPSPRTSPPPPAAPHLSPIYTFFYGRASNHFVKYSNQAKSAPTTGDRGEGLSHGSYLDFLRVLKNFRSGRTSQYFVWR